MMSSRETARSEPDRRIGFTPPRSDRAYRIYRFGSSLVARSLFDIRVTGTERLTAASGRPTLLACVPHRNWSEPLLLSAVVPAGLRTILVADGPTIERSRLRLALARRIGRVLPVWPKSGAASFASHLAEARRALDGGNALIIFSETGPPAPAPRLRRISPSIAWFAAATGAQVVPLIFGGTDELYLRRHIEVSALPPIAPPPPEALEDRRAIVEWMRTFRDIVQAAAEELESAANANPPRYKLGRWLTGNYPRVTSDRES